MRRLWIVEEKVPAKRPYFVGIAFFERPADAHEYVDDLAYTHRDIRVVEYVPRPKRKMVKR